MLSLHLKSTFSLFHKRKGSSLLLLGTIIFTICVTVLWYLGSNRVLEGLSMGQPEREPSHFDGSSLRERKSAGVNLRQKGSR